MSWFMKMYESVDKKQIFEEKEFLLFETDRLKIYLRDNIHFRNGDTTYLHVWSYTPSSGRWLFVRSSVLRSQRNGFYIVKFNQRFYLDNFTFSCIENLYLTPYEYGCLAFEDGLVRKPSSHREFAAAHLHIAKGTNAVNFLEWNQGWSDCSKKKVSSRELQPV